MVVNPWVWSKSINGGYNTYIQLDGTWYGADPSSGYFTAASATTLTITTGTTSIYNLNKSGDDYLLYAFNEVEGYSKFGSYTGNNNADGPFIYTGFSPAWVVCKSYGTTGTHYDWPIYDSTRSPY